MEVESKLVPILREGVEVVKMIFFKELQGYLAARFPDKEKGYLNRLAGAVINELFGTPNQDEAFVDFVRQEQEVIKEVLHEVGDGLEKMRIPLTDALRTMVLCDHQEGADNSALLDRARECGILLADRDLPMPNSFIELVRRLGNSLGVLTPPAPEN